MCICIYIYNINTHIYIYSDDDDDDDDTMDRGTISTIGTKERIFNELKGWSCMRRSIAVGACGSLGGRLRFTRNCGGSFIVKNEFLSEPNVFVVDDDRA